MMKRVVSFFLAGVLCFGLLFPFQIKHADAATDGIQKKIDSIAAVYPSGSYFTPDGGPCYEWSHYNGDSPCSGCALRNIPARGNLPAGSEVGLDYSECAGFANYVFYCIYGHNCWNDTTNTSSPVFGDLVKVSNSETGVHWFIYLGDSHPVHGSGYYCVYDSNGYDYASYNEVKYGNYYPKAGTTIQTIFHANNYDKVNRVCSKDHSNGKNFTDGYCDECGAWQPNKNDNASYSAGTYNTVSDTYIRVHPYAISDTEHGEPGIALPKNAKVIVDGAVVNGVDHLWYHVSYGNVSGYVYSDRLTKTSSSTTKYYLGIDGLLDGTNKDDIKNYGTCDVYVNGKRVANDVDDFYAEYPAGTKYTIRDVKAKAGKVFAGATGYDECTVVVGDDQTAENCYSGTITSSKAGVTIRLEINSRSSWETIPSGNYNLKNNATNTVLDVADAGDFNGCNVWLCAANGTNAQIWNISGNDSSRYIIKPACTIQRILNQHGDSVATGHNIDIWDNVNDDTQKWCFESVSGGYVIRLAANTNYVLDADENGNAVICEYAGRASQVWKLIKVGATNPPQITKQPEDKTVTVTSTAKFSVEASGAGLNYQWQYRKNASSEWKNSGQSGNKTATLSVATTAGLHGYQFRCIVTDNNGQAISNIATLKLKPRITTQPEDTTVAVGNKATFTVEATGKSELTYQWQYRKNENDDWKTSGQSGNKTATLTVSTTAGLHGYQFRCIVTDGNSQKSYTKAVTLSVRPKITTWPKDTTAAPGTTAKFTIAATGKGTLKYQWQYRRNANDTWKTSGQSGNKTSTLSVAVTAALNGYQFRCYVTDENGQRSYTNTVTLTVSPRITTQPANKTVTAGTAAKFTVVAAGTGTLTYQWQYRKNSSDTWKTSGQSGNKTATLSVATKASLNGYQFRCVVKDSDGRQSISNVVTLTVK